MRRIPMVFAALALLSSCHHGKHAQLEPDRATLSNVRVLFLGDFGRSDGADLIRERIRLRLISSGRFSVVDSPDKAEAVLTGATGVEKSRGDNGASEYAGFGILRLVEIRTEKNIWAHEYKAGFLRDGAASTKVADQMADQLLKDAATPR